MILASLIIQWVSSTEATVSGNSSWTGTLAYPIQPTGFFCSVSDSNNVNMRTRTILGSTSLEVAMYNNSGNKSMQ